MNWIEGSTKNTDAERWRRCCFLLFCINCHGQNADCMISPGTAVCRSIPLARCSQGQGVCRVVRMVSRMKARRLPTSPQDTYITYSSTLPTQPTGLLYHCSHYQQRHCCFSQDGPLPYGHATCMCTQPFCNRIPNECLQTTPRFATYLYRLAAQPLQGHRQ